MKKKYKLNCTIELRNREVRSVDNILKEKKIVEILFEEIFPKNLIGLSKTVFFKFEIPWLSLLHDRKLYYNNDYNWI